MKHSLEPHEALLKYCDLEGHSAIQRTNARFAVIWNYYPSYSKLSNTPICTKIFAELFAQFSRTDYFVLTAQRLIRTRFYCTVLQFTRILYLIRLYYSHHLYHITADGMVSVVERCRCTENEELIANLSASYVDAEDLMTGRRCWRILPLSRIERFTLNYKQNNVIQV
jgi:hypothetical protein